MCACSLGTALSVGVCEGSLEGSEAQPSSAAAASSIWLAFPRPTWLASLAAAPPDTAGDYHGLICDDLLLLPLPLLLA